MEESNIFITKNQGTIWLKSNGKSIVEEYIDEIKNENIQEELEDAFFGKIVTLWSQLGRDLAWLDKF